MSIAEAMVGEFAQESVTTRKLLERVPEDKMAWKPHEKSMSMGRLAQHVAEIPEWTAIIVNQETFDMATVDRTPKDIPSKQALLDLFDKNVEDFKKILGGQPDEHLFKNWKLLSGEHVAVEMPRVACLRGFIVSHTIHHRGQLSVYLRENDVPVPSIYGPSADEAM